MIYMLKVYALVAVFVLAPTALVVLALLACNKVKEYVVARHVMQRIAAGQSPMFNDRTKAA